MDKQTSAPRAARIAVSLIAMAIAIGVILAGCGSSSSSSSDSGEEVSFTGTGVPNGDLANTRELKSEINSSNVGELAPAWKMPLTASSAFGSYASAPIIDKGVMYSQDLVSNV